ncbi:MAG TPA: SUMF1/EgtB/PvdO family nonheme iron enzyme [Polyangiaceae bacterium LLY-WYZ-15_(1-7)]|nr:SUMF1/EgtB/PvdO family nonheme iron enzyme [Polyangiaceae bacterium LLY-WYZ-15_(1-7)]
MRSWTLSSGLAAVLALSACGDDGAGEDDAGTTETDAAMVDATTPEPDATTPEPDAGEPDAGEPDAGPEPCSEEGAMRTASCGNCGMTSERCEGGIWVADVCLNEGECAAGTLETEDLPMCARRARLCNDSCEWGAWDELEPASTCEAGDERIVVDGCEPGENKRQVCSDSCEWEDATTCTSPCGDLRTTPAHAEELCVPAGPFMRGDGDEYPYTEIFVSSFAIARYPVTYSRYRECVDAGACSDEDFGFGTQRNWDDIDSHLDEPIIVTHRDARTFCMWDGGRRLPTDAELQKASRGPAPRTNAYPYGPDEYDCDIRPIAGCPDHESCGPPVGSYPAASSYYGLEDLYGNALSEMTSDYWDPEYYDDPASRVPDPTGPGETELGFFVGSAGCSISPMRRLGTLQTASDGTFRCVRDLD